MGSLECNNVWVPPVTSSKVKYLKYWSLSRGRTRVPAGRLTVHATVQNLADNISTHNQHFRLKTLQPFSWTVPCAHRR